MTDLDRTLPDLPPTSWEPPAEAPLWSSGPGSLDETGEIPLARALTADRTQVFEVPPQLVAPAPAPAPVAARPPRRSDRFWAWAVWAGAAAALVLVVVTWLGTEGQDPADRPTTATTDVEAATERSPAPLVEASPTTRAPQPATAATAPPTPTTAPPVDQTIVLQDDPFPPGFPFEDS